MRTASEARGSTIPAIQKPHPALCHLGGSRVLRWLTFCSALDGHRAMQEQAKNWPKRPKNGPKLAIFGCTSERRAADSERSERQHRPCYTKAPSSPVPPGGFQGAEMADILLRSRWSPRNARTGQKRAKTGQKRAKTGHFWLRERAASGGQRAKLYGSTIPAIRKPHPALCHPGGSRVLRWLTFCSAHDGRRATQEQAKNWPKRPKNGPKLAIFGCASERRAADSERSERQHRPCYTKAPSSPKTG